MRLENLIADLLYQHDCVVIPGFGGLVANYRPAKLNRQTHLIYPPSKHIGFNRHLKNNDGLLVAHLAGIMAIPYKDAQQTIDQIVADWHRSLQQEGRIFWEKIGTFFFDKSGSLQFIPEEQENFLLSSYGLTLVQLTPVVQATTPVVALKPSEEKRQSPSIAWRVAAAMAVPILFAGIWAVGNQHQSGDFNFASLNPFHTEHIITAYSPKAMDEPLEAWTPATSPMINYLNDTVNTEIKRFDFNQLQFTDNGIPIIRNRKALPDKTIKAEGKNAHAVKKQVVTRAKYAVIGGAFADEQNAQRFLDKLIQDGFDASFAGKHGNLQLVAYGFYPTADEAKIALRNIQNSGSAWIKRF